MVSGNEPVNSPRDFSAQLDRVAVCLHGIQLDLTEDVKNDDFIGDLLAGDVEFNIAELSALVVRLESTVRNQQLLPTDVAILSEFSDEINEMKAASHNKLQGAVFEDANPVATISEERLSELLNEIARLQAGIVLARSRLGLENQDVPLPTGMAENDLGGTPTINLSRSSRFNVVEGHGVIPAPNFNQSTVDIFPLAELSQPVGNQDVISEALEHIKSGLPAIEFNAAPVEAIEGPELSALDRDIVSIQNGIVLLVRLHDYYNSEEFKRECVLDEAGKMQKANEDLGALQLSIEMGLMKLKDNVGIQSGLSAAYHRAIGVSINILPEIDFLLKTRLIHTGMDVDIVELQNSSRDQLRDVSCHDIFGPLFDNSIRAITDYSDRRSSAPVSFNAQSTMRDDNLQIPDSYSAATVNELKEGDSTVQINKPMKGFNICSVQYRDEHNILRSDFYVEDLKQIQGKDPAFYMEWAAREVENWRAGLSDLERQSQLMVLTRGPAFPDELVYAIQSYCVFNQYESNPRVRQGQADLPFEADRGKVASYSAYLEKNQFKIEQDLGILIGPRTTIEARIAAIPEALAMVAAVDSLLVEARLQPSKPLINSSPMP